LDVGSVYFVVLAGLRWLHDRREREAATAA
jgi:hypothetical protein